MFIVRRFPIGTKKTAGRPSAAATLSLNIREGGARNRGCGLRWQMECLHLADGHHNDLQFTWHIHQIPLECLMFMMMIHKVFITCRWLFYFLFFRYSFDGVTSLHSPPNWPFCYMILRREIDFQRRSSLWVGRSSTARSKGIKYFHCETRFAARLHNLLATISYATFLLLPKPHHLWLHHNTKSQPLVSLSRQNYTTHRIKMDSSNAIKSMSLLLLPSPKTS